MTSTLSTGAHGFTVEFLDHNGSGELRIRFDASSALNADFALSQKHPAVAAEMALEGIEKGGLSYLQFSLIAGLLINLCRARAKVPTLQEIKDRNGGWR